MCFSQMNGVWMFGSALAICFLLANINSCSPSSSVFRLSLGAPGTKLSSRPALFSLTSTSFHRGTRPRLESGSVPHLCLPSSSNSPVSLLFFCAWSADLVQTEHCHVGCLRSPAMQEIVCSVIVLLWG